MLAILVTCSLSISKFVVSYGYFELTISKESQLELSKDLYPNYWNAIFLNNEDFQDLNLTYSANLTSFSPIIIPKNGPTVLKFVITMIDKARFNSLSIVYNGGDGTFNTFKFTKDYQYVLFLSSTEFYYRFNFKRSGYVSFQSEPYEPLYVSRGCYDNGYKKYLLLRVHTRGSCKLQNLEPYF